MRSVSACSALIAACRLAFSTSSSCSAPCAMSFWCLSQRFCSRASPASASTCFWMSCLISTLSICSAPMAWSRSDVTSASPLRISAILASRRSFLSFSERRARISSCAACMRCSIWSRRSSREVSSCSLVRRTSATALRSRSSSSLSCSFSRSIFRENPMRLEGAHTMGTAPGRVCSHLYCVPIIMRPPVVAGRSVMAPRPDWTRARGGGGMGWPAEVLGRVSSSSKAERAAAATMGREGRMMGRPPYPLAVSISADLYLWELSSSFQAFMVGMVAGVPRVRGKVRQGVRKRSEDLERRNRRAACGPLRASLGDPSSLFSREPANSRPTKEESRSPKELN
mmetsp:Transcript_48265/g.154568  ORF Transcript_48265/g.154568 Transcript_48265/m.154568 type:complete len:340 (+) Transcript_48265:671-1690(+)